MSGLQRPASAATAHARHTTNAKFAVFRTRSLKMSCTWKLLASFMLLGLAPCVSYSTAGPPPTMMRLRGGSEAPQFTAEQIKRLPWYLILENSPLKLGDGPYGLPYVKGSVNPKNTLWDSNPKLAMSRTLWNVAEDNADAEHAAKLLKIGADANFADSKTKATPLHLAAMHGNTKLAVLLVENGADVKRRCKKAGTPLDIAKSYNHLETVTAMLDAAARSK